MKPAPAEPDDQAGARRLIEAVQQLSLARDLAAVMAIVRRAARDLTGADGATFVLREGDQCFYADEDAIGPLWKGKRFPMSACISGWAMENKRSAVIEDIYDDNRVPTAAYEPTFVKSLAMVPIRQDAPVGAIGTYWAAKHQASPVEVEWLQALANSTSIAMENVQLYAEMEQRVQDRTAQLQAANKELEAFSYSVSHDLRTPLLTIDALCKLVLDRSGSQLEDTDRERLRQVRDAVAHMGTLIEDLLRLSRLARTDLQRQPVDLTQMARDVAARLLQDGSSRQVEFAIDEDIEAHGDPHLLRVVLDNLMGNAWKFTSAKPVAHIAVGATRSSDGHPVYHVQDDGAGFDMTQASRLFSPFQRLHTQSEFPGTGVGLATVARIVEKHGGRIWTQAEVGRGARFSFTLG